MRRLGLLAGVAVVSAFVVPELLNAPSLDHVALALALAGPACGAALAAATGRPLLAASALAGIGAYVSAIVSLHGVGVPAAVLCGCAAGATAGGLITALGARLGSPGFLVVTVLIALAAGDGVQALPGLTGGQAGLAIKPLSFSLGGHRTLALTPRGDFHILLVVAVVVAGTSAILIRRGPGAAWRAIGSDRMRASDSGLIPLAGEAAVLVIAGAMAGICGALGAHVNQIATPTDFGVYVGALPLLAALCARNEPVSAAFIAVATGIMGGVLLPSAGWTGPPSAQSLALAALALATLITAFPGGSGTEQKAEAVVDPDEPWPVGGLGLRGAVLDVSPIICRSQRGAVLADAPGFRVAPGIIHAVLGANGSGKSTLLREIRSRAARRAAGVRIDGVARLLLLPQEGGGFANCSVVETLNLAARRRRSPDEAAQLTADWLRRLGLEPFAHRRCSELSAGQRRLLDLARVLLGSPSVLLCDEPLAGLDDVCRAAAISCLAAAASAGLTIVISEHDREAVVRLARSVTELDRAGKPLVGPAVGPALGTP